MLWAYYNKILSECRSCGKCAHVLALIITTETWKINKSKEVPAEPASTSLPHQCDKPRGPKVLPEPVSQMIISRPGNINRKRKPDMTNYNDNRYTITLMPIFLIMKQSKKICNTRFNLIAKKYSNN